MPLLEQAVTLLLDYGLQVWTFWQDMEQVRPNYPSRHEALINNAALQLCGISKRMIARQMTEVLACSSADLLTMKNEESRVFMKGQGNAPSFVFQISNLKYEISNRTISACWARGQTSQCQPRAVLRTRHEAIYVTRIVLTGTACSRVCRTTQ